MTGLVLVDKDAGPTSHDVVRFARRAFGTRSVGHTGTLDPFATGLLVLAVGEATKLVAHLTEDDKEYRATVRFGVETDSLDPTGTVVTEAAVPDLDLARVAAAAGAMIGRGPQVPPSLSAIKLGGVPLHRRVRRGEAVAPQAREVELHAVRVDAARGDRAELTLRVGKGFYVRSFARDLARALGTVGHLEALRRTAVGSHDVRDALPAEVLRHAASGDELARARLSGALLDLRAAWGSRPVVTLSLEGAHAARQGRPIGASLVTRGLGAEERGAEVGGQGPCDGTVGLLHPSGALWALGRRAGGGLRVVRGLWGPPGA